MFNFAGMSPPLARAETDSHQLIASELRALIARIESSMRLIDAAMAQGGSSDPAGSHDVVVLDDVTPRYAAASAALDTCRAGLGRALQHLSDVE